MKVSDNGRLPWFFPDYGEEKQNLGEYLAAQRSQFMVKEKRRKKLGFTFLLTSI